MPNTILHFLVRPARLCFAMLLCFWLLPLSAWAVKFPDKPTDAYFYVDQASLIQPVEAKQLNEIASRLLAEEMIPIFVVTIPSLASLDAGTMTIEQYAAALFNEWGIGFEKRNNGMLFLISQMDRKARIELGADWGHTYDLDAQRVMDTLVIPQFKQGNFSLGILEGVRGMEAMARGLQLPKPTAPWWFWPVVIGSGIFVVLLVYNLFKSGKTGWAWAVIVAVGALLFFMLRNAGNSGSSSGFGGGFSGGGGASGSW